MVIDGHKTRRIQHSVTKELAWTKFVLLQNDPNSELILSKDKILL